MSTVAKLKELQEEIESVIAKQDEFVLMKKSDESGEYVPTEVSREEFLAFYLAILVEDLGILIDSISE